MDEEKYAKVKVGMIEKLVGQNETKKEDDGNEEEDNVIPPDED